ncbi:extracellular solute-binding protein [Paenibacillus sp. GCM10023248]|uniref:extracellular solute-binding protein n=1 Tax=Bacillales TaxID=1385 RepID=UPI002377EB70|nr:MULTISPECIES: extracellular solute-binding protein [Bacillales]MDD9266696.1 extracellular solute-binding protein [Paenibacillus sp. MAHUQ-63]MDR6883641.1 putative aldouronate transport system substrate-binding protein [Bacillus sp. 3255]
MSKKWMKWSLFSLASVMLLVGCQDNVDQAATKDSQPANEPSAAGKPATWIADRTIKGRLFIDSDDLSKDINPEIAKKLKEMTGITLQLEGVTADHAIDALTAGLASNDLPDFILYYLNNSGRKEMSVILKGAREGMFTDLTPLIKNSSIYSKYLQDKYLPLDTQYGVMFRPEFKGSSYFIHMNIPREGGYQETKYVGGPYIRKDIVDALGIDPKSIQTSDQLYELAKKIKAGGFKDKNGKDVYPIGPRYWGGREVGALYNDLVWGADEQRIHQTKDGKIVHESKTEYPMKRVAYVQKLLSEKLMVPEFYTMEENRGTEGILNGSYAIIADMHNYLEFNKDAHYVPLGPMNSVDGPYQMQLDYKTGYMAWSIPKTTKNPQDIVKLADFLASREGKLLWQYGIEGRDYTLDAKGNPIVKKEVLELKNKDPKAAKALGFDGVGNSWGSYLGSTDLNRQADFNEMQYGDAAAPEANAGPLKIVEMWGYEEKRKNAKLNDGYQPLAFLGEFEQETQLKDALKKYDDSMIRAFYAKNLDEAKKIIDAATAQLKSAGLDKYEELLMKKNADPKTKVIVN